MLYSYLNASPSDTQEELRAKFKALSRISHPDKAPEGKESQYLEIFREVESAYSVLSDPLKKHIYDRYSTEGMMYYDGMGEYFELAWQETDPKKRDEMIENLVQLCRVCETDRQFLSLYPTQRLKFTLNMVEFTALKSLPHDLMDIFSISKIGLSTGVNIGKNGSLGKIGFRL